MTSSTKQEEKPCKLLAVLNSLQSAVYDGSFDRARELYLATVPIPDRHESREPRPILPSEVIEPFLYYCYKVWFDYCMRNDTIEQWQELLSHIDTIRYICVINNAVHASIASSNYEVAMTIIAEDRIKALEKKGGQDGTNTV